MKVNLQKSKYADLSARRGERRKTMTNYTLMEARHALNYYIRELREWCKDEKIPEFEKITHKNSINRAEKEVKEITEVLRKRGIYYKN